MCPTNVNVAVVFAGSVAMVHVVVVLGTPQAKVGPPVWLNETNVIGDGVGDPAGRVSVHETLFASRAWYGAGRFLGPSITWFYRSYPLAVQGSWWRDAGFEQVRYRTMAVGGGIVRT